MENSVRLFCSLHKAWMVIARISGSVNWLFIEQDYGYTDLLAKVDTINGSAKGSIILIIILDIQKKRHG